jgi:hypothetical protein
MRSETGAELACRAHEKAFEDGGRPVRRGVVSYYAAATLASATTPHSWLRSIEKMSQEDMAQGAITRFHLPILQIMGDGNLPLIGRSSRTENHVRGHTIHSRSKTP